MSRASRVQAHGKLTIVDGRIAALGSMARVALSLRVRREIAVTVEEPKCIRKLKNFYRLLASGRELMDPAKAAAFVDRKSTRLNSSHLVISYAVFCLKKK